MTNYVELIRIPHEGKMLEFHNTPETPLTSEQIIGLLSASISPWPSVTNNTNPVIARVKATTGAAVAVT